jgi:hypothetical protein
MREVEHLLLCYDFELTAPSAVNAHMRAKRVQEFSSQYMNAAQSLTMTCGLIGGLYLVVLQVAQEGKSIGELTTFLAYWAQLQGNSPLQIRYLECLLKYRSFILL